MIWRELQNHDMEENYKKDDKKGNTKKDDMEGITKKHDMEGNYKKDDKKGITKKVVSCKIIWKELRRNTRISPNEND